MDTLITVGQLVLSLSILIVLHEFGHFLPARLFGTRVEKFYLFFDPYFSLVKKKIGETEWGIGWLPLGGYVKISGMIDESFDKEQLAKPPEPWEFRSKPAWQRLIIMLGGVTVNFFLGFLIFSMVLWVYGEEYLPTENATNGIYVDSLGQDLGLQDGDLVLRADTTQLDRFGARYVLQAIAIDGARQLTVRRNGTEVDLPVANEWSDILTRRENKYNPLFSLPLPFFVGEIIEDSPAEESDLREGDRILAVDGNPVTYFQDALKLLRQRKSQSVTITARGEDDATERNVTLTTREDGTIGVRPRAADQFYQMERIDYDFGESFPAGWDKGVNFLGSQFKAFGKMFQGDIKVTESLGGFISIGSMFGDTWIWERFWLMTASLSLILAFMNLLPIPALDGGHVVFLLYEVISGRKPSDRFMEIAQVIGFIIVLGLVLLANGLDIWNLIKGWFGG